MEVELDRISKRFEDAGLAPGDGNGPPAALRDVSIGVHKGELMVVVGPSGCGKSTTLRIVAGLEHADAGTLRIGGKDMGGVAPQDRDVAMVFQGYALYPQMTVRENIEFPLKMRKTPPSERARLADEAAAMLRLGALMNRLPAELSGGERQRVAMGRAIVRRPRVFLFDEPLSNLDAALRQELRVEIGVLVRELGATAVYVTHDQVEAMTLADRICVMEKGRVLTIATPRAIYEAPETSFVATFLGSPRMNLVPARVEAGILHAGPFALAAPKGLAGTLVVGIRPEEIRLAEGEGARPFDVVVTEPLGAETHLVLASGDVELRVRTPGWTARAPGERVSVSLEGARLHYFAADGDGRRLDGPGAPA